MLPKEKVCAHLSQDLNAPQRHRQEKIEYRLSLSPIARYSGTYVNLWE